MVSQKIFEKKNIRRNMRRVSFASPADILKANERDEVCRRFGFVFVYWAHFHKSIIFLCFTRWWRTVALQCLGLDLSHSVESQ